MAADFIGYDVCVTLKAHPDAKILGEVADVAGQRLMLRNGMLYVPVVFSFEANMIILTCLAVTFLSSGHHLPIFPVDGTEIADLSLEPRKRSARPSHSQYAERESSVVTPQPIPVPVPERQNFTDPAILSFSKPSFKQDDRYVEHRSSSSREVPSTRVAAEPIRSLPVHTETPEADTLPTKQFSRLGLDTGRKSAGIRGGLEETPAEGSIPSNVGNTVSFETQVKSAGRRPRRGRDGTTSGHVATASTNPKSKGWRQTALVEPSNQDETQLDYGYEDKPSSRYLRRGKKGRGKYTEEANGWATEDATDIQEMGDFDFQSNLSKFDKGRIFEQFRNGDTTAEEARLISFNRMAKPGTNGGKNLHWTENVLDSPQNSDVEETEEEHSETKMSNEYYSGRELSRTSTRIQGSRKGSAMLGQPLVPQQISTITRTQLSRTTSPRSGDRSISAASISGPSLRLTTTNRSCPTLSPLQALEIEQLAVGELGLIEEIITENAGRGIAEAAVSQLPSESSAPAILILTGNHRTGARVTAAARHFRNRGHRVTLCMLGLEHENELLESCRKQLDIFRKVGGRVIRYEELLTRLSTSDFNNDLVVDALFGIHLAFEDLRNDDQAAVFEIISWINRNSVDVLSVDVPSGLSASSGKSLASY